MDKLACAPRYAVLRYVISRVSTSKPDNTDVLLAIVSLGCLDSKLLASLYLAAISPSASTVVRVGYFGTCNLFHSPPSECAVTPNSRRMHPNPRKQVIMNLFALYQRHQRPEQGAPFAHQLRQVLAVERLLSATRNSSLPALHSLPRILDPPQPLGAQDALCRLRAVGVVRHWISKCVVTDDAWAGDAVCGTFVW
jgi:hypothetical protein